MSSGPGVQFYVDTKDAVASLVALRKELTKTLAAMGGNSAPQLSNLAKGMTQAEVATRKLTQETEKLGRQSEDTAQAIIRTRIRMGDSVTSFNAQASASDQAYYNFNKELNRQRLTEGTEANRAYTQALTKYNNDLQNNITQVIQREEARRLQNQLEVQSHMSSARDKEYSGRLKREQALTAELAKIHTQTNIHMARVFQEQEDKKLKYAMGIQAQMSQMRDVGRSSQLKAEQKHLADLQKLNLDATINMGKVIEAERSKRFAKEKADTLSQYKALERAQANHLAELQRQEQKAMAFRESSLQSQISKINKVLALQRSGRFLSLIHI